MSELRFSCPSCGQMVECEKAYGGHVIHCPNCVAEIRIPFSNTALPTELSVPKAQLVLEPPPGTKPSVGASPAANLEFICPVCQSELRAPATAAPRPKAGPPTAELLRRGPEPDQPKPETKPETKTAPPLDDKQHKSYSEHEQEIAAARAAQPIQLHETVKPRLSYILSNSQPPASESTPPGKEPEPPPDNHKTFPE